MNKLHKLRAFLRGTPPSRSTTKNSRKQAFRRRLRTVENLEPRQLLANNFLAGTAFEDANSNGKLDAPDSYLAGATIELRSSDGSTLIATDVTDAKGAYLFDNLAPGDYQLVNLSADGFYSSSSQAKSKISPVTASTSNSINVTLADPANLRASIDITAFFNSNLFRPSATVSSELPYRAAVGNSH